MQKQNNMAKNLWANFHVHRQIKLTSILKCTLGKFRSV